jgi:D-glycero-D-manno-heptose 1,7-bisphosphate phosphatase
LTKRALFLDRDGVVNVDRGYVHKPEDVEFVDGIFELVSEAVRCGYLIVIVTNQAGIGRGLYSEQDFHGLMDWMKSEFESRQGRIDAVYFSPFHPEHGVGAYRRVSDCRKPAPGMIIRARHELDIDLSRSILIGDKQSDVDAGIKAGIGQVLRLRVTGDMYRINSRRISSLRDVLSFL